MIYRKIPKINPGACLYFSKALFEGLIYGGKLMFQIDWASVIVGSKFTFFALFYFVFEGKFPSTSPRGAYILRGGLTDGFFFCITGLGGLYLEGLIKVYIEGPIFGIYGMYFQLQQKTHLIILIIIIIIIILVYSTFLQHKLNYKASH